jgi:hypothetical protein
LSNRRWRHTFALGTAAAGDVETAATPVAVVVRKVAVTWWVGTWVTVERVDMPNRKVVAGLFSA